MTRQSKLSWDDVELLVETTSRRIDAGEVTLHAVEAGLEDGELVVPLHSFLECWYAWADYLHSFSEAGYRAAAPDQRDYNPSDHPLGVEWYSIDELAGDMVGVADVLGRETTYVVGHDWGGVVAWWIALHHPDWVRSFTVMSLPHPAVLVRYLRHDPGQQPRSWYVLFFQLSKPLELVVPVSDWAVLERAMTGSTPLGTFPAAGLDHYRAAWSVSEAHGSMVDWYCAVVHERSRPRAETIDVPTLVVRGSKDRFPRPKMAGESLAFCRDGHLKTFEEATHWVYHEEPVAVARAVAEHLDDTWRIPNNTPDEADHRPV